MTSSLATEPGTVVQFDRDARLSVSSAGSIAAVGTPDARIRLEGRLQVQGFWYGLCFGPNRASRLEYADLLWAGRVFTGGSHVCSAAVGGVNGEPVTVKNSLIANSAACGVSVGESSAFGQFGNVYRNSPQGICD